MKTLQKQLDRTITANIINNNYKETYLLILNVCAKRSI